MTDIRDHERYGDLVANNEDVAWAIDYHMQENPEDSMYGFESICHGFYHLAGGLLKLHNGPLKGSGLLEDESKRLLTAHKKIIDDFLGTGECG